MKRLITDDGFNKHSLVLNNEDDEATEAQRSFSSVREICAKNTPALILKSK